MIAFPNCKINLGLRVTARRPDGYHDIETVMFPVRGLCDALEVLPDRGEGCLFTSSGLTIDAPAERNLCVRAYELLKARYGIGGVRMHLHKHIPFGAGLGGGSSDAVFALRMLGEAFALDLSAATLESLAGELGSDTVFFVRNRPMLATGRGEILTPIEVDLSRYYLVLVKPDIAVSTADAYRGVTPRRPETPLAEVLAQDVSQWKELLVNDFEASVFAKFPVLDEIKQEFYAQGAVYAAMSGSGSTIFGLFETLPKTLSNPADGFMYSEKML